MAFVLAWILPAVAAPATPVADLEPYLEGAWSALEMPAGCWDIDGIATWSWDLGRFGRQQGIGRFTGRVEEGVWVGYALRPPYAPRLPAHALPPEGDAHFRPLVGRHPTLEVDGERGPSSALAFILDQLTGDTDTAFAVRERGVVVLDQDLSLARRRRNPPTARLTAVFPEGSLHPTDVRIVFPQEFHKGLWPRFRIEDAAVRLIAKTVHGRLFPATEHIAAEVGSLGFTFRGEQTVTYERYAPCTVARP